MNLKNQTILGIQILLGLATLGIDSASAQSNCEALFNVHRAEEMIVVRDVTGSLREATLIRKIVRPDQPNRPFYTVRFSDQTVETDIPTNRAYVNRSGNGLGSRTIVNTGRGNGRFELAAGTILGELEAASARETGPTTEYAVRLEITGEIHAINDQKLFNWIEPYQAIVLTPESVNSTSIDPPAVMRVKVVGRKPDFAMTYLAVDVGHGQLVSVAASDEFRPGGMFQGRQVTVTQLVSGAVQKPRGQVIAMREFRGGDLPEYVIELENGQLILAPRRGFEVDF